MFEMTGAVEVSIIILFDRHFAAEAEIIVWKRGYFLLHFASFCSSFLFIPLNLNLNLNLNLDTKTNKKKIKALKKLLKMISVI